MTKRGILAHRSSHSFVPTPAPFSSSGEGEESLSRASSHLSARTASLFHQKEHSVAVPRPVVLAKPRFFYGGVGYCSLSEAACAAMLERFVAQFKINPGHSYQIPIGDGRSVDFLVNGVLIEFHNPRLRRTRGSFGDFETCSEFVNYRRALRRARGNHFRTKRLMEGVHEQVRHTYYKRRRSYIDRHPKFAGLELVVTTTVEDFYRQVIIRFSSRPYPSEHEFISLFYEMVARIGRERQWAQP